MKKAAERIWKVQRTGAVIYHGTFEDTRTIRESVPENVDRVDVKCKDREFMLDVYVQFSRGRVVLE